MGHVKLSHKKDGRQRRPHRFHVSWHLPYSATGSALWGQFADSEFSVKDRVQSQECSKVNYLSHNNVYLQQFLFVNKHYCKYILL